MLESLSKLILAGLGSTALGVQIVVWYSFFWRTPRQTHQTRTLTAANHTSNVASFIFIIIAMVDSQISSLGWRHLFYAVALLCELASSYFATKVMRERQEMVRTATDRLEHLQKKLEVIRREIG